MRRRNGGGGRGLENWLPLGYFVAALLLVVALLPSVLRPPQQPPTQTAELSPDAPSDDEQQAIISSLNRGSSGTTGAGSGTGDGDAIDAPATAIPPASSPLARSCRKGFGNPPRQTESIYSAPCAPVFTGENGGATYRGVTRTEIRVGITGCSYNASKDGPIGTTPAEDGNGVDTTLRVYTAWMNENFQFYGRKMRMYFVKPSECTSPGLIAAVNKLYNDYEIGILMSEQDFAHGEGVRLKMLSGASYQQSEEFYRKAYPYDFSFAMDGSKVVRLSTELMCKQLVGKPVSYTVPPLQGQPRVFGALVQGNDEFLNAGSQEAEFDRQCGQQYGRVIRIEAHASNDQLAAAITQMRTSGVNNVACYCPWNTVTAISRVATAQGWYPEWLVTGTRETDSNFLATTFDPAQWDHAFGIHTKEMPRPAPETDWFKAYKEIDPGGSPDFTVGRYGFLHFLQLANAIQMAGPALTPRNALEGLQRLPRVAPDPIWAVAGGYGPGDYTFADYVGLVWWDGGAQDPDVGGPGAYRFVLDGKRFAEGEIPTEPLPFFRSGITQPPRR